MAGSDVWALDSDNLSVLTIYVIILTIYIKIHRAAKSHRCGWLHLTCPAQTLPLRFVEIKGHYLPKWRGELGRQGWREAGVTDSDKFPCPTTKGEREQCVGDLSEAGWAQLKAHRIIAFCETDISYTGSLSWMGFHG